jgi:hypothetical protein
VTANTIDARNLRQSALNARTGKRGWMGGYIDFVTVDLTCKEVDGARSSRQGVLWTSAAVLVLVRVGLRGYLTLTASSSRYLAPSLAVLPYRELAKLGNWGARSSPPYLGAMQTPPSADGCEVELAYRYSQPKIV